jgi:hypothetical protein
LKYGIRILFEKNDSVQFQFAFVSLILNQLIFFLNCK